MSSLEDQNTGRFVRLPSDLLDALLRVPLNGTQWRILLWVIRNTCGWNRPTTVFRWYRIAKELRLDRGGVVRAGNRLLCASVLLIQDHQVGINMSPDRWQNIQNRPAGDDARPRAMTAVIADAGHRNRGRPSSLLRRAKDRYKDIKDISANPSETAQRLPPTTRYHPAGSARPVPGKYDNVSEV